MRHARGSTHALSSHARGGAPWCHWAMYEGIHRRVTVDHLTLPVSDIVRSRLFYETSLAELDFVVREGKDWVAFGAPGAEDFCIAEGDPGDPGGIHITFLAAASGEVDAWHAAALAAGGTDNGGPGPRERHGPRCYGAYVRDPDGYNLEALFHGHL
jgi:catechol 2,3-dioxygenase-like lactoylglutathione lyase family enzyme